MFIISKVRNELRYQLSNPLEAAGKQFTTLPSMNSILKGHRRGELTVITGPTGAWQGEEAGGGGSRAGVEGV